MKLGFADICLNCANLSESFRCSLHNAEVEINNFCDDHNHNTNLNKDSSCLNCASFQKSECSFTERSGEGMLCFDWKKV